MTYEQELEQYEQELEAYHEQIAEAGMGYACEGFSGSEATELARHWIGPPPTPPVNPNPPKPPELAGEPVDDDVPY